MAMLADLFAQVHLNLETGKFQADAVAEADSAGDKMSQSLSAKLKSGFSGIGTGIMQGLGQGVFNMVTQGIGDVVGSLGDMMNAGAEEQAQIGSLSAALRANASGWDGNTAAIEKRNQVGMAMAFSNDDLTASLTKLIPVTKDVDKAFQVQSVAMDLARFKNISLVDASEVLAKAMMGSGKALKDLGINVKSTTDATTMLADVERVVSGQAATYAESDLGRLEKVRNGIEKLKEDVGAFLDDTVAHAQDYMSQMNQMGAWMWSTGRGGILGAGSMWMSEDDRKAYAEYLQMKKDDEQETARLASVQANYAAVAAAAADATVNYADAMREAASGGHQLATSIVSTVNPLQGTITAAAALAARFPDATGAMDTVTTASDQLAVALQGVTDHYSALNQTIDEKTALKDLPDHIIVATGAVKQARIDLAKAGTAEAKAAARIRLNDAEAELAKLKNDLASSANRTALANAGTTIGNAWGKALYDQVKYWVDLVGNVHIQTPHLGTSPTHPGKGAVPTAEGGYRPAFMPLLMGEKGPELTMFDRASWTIPAGPTANILAGASVSSAITNGGTTFTGPININAPTRPMTTRDIGMELRRVEAGFR